LHHNGDTVSRFLLFVSLLTLVSCQNLGERTTIVIVGATLLSGPGNPPINDSVVVISGGRIRSVGTRAAAPIPQNSERVNAIGQFLVPVRIGDDRRAWIERTAASTVPPQQVLRKAVTAFPGGAADFVLLRKDPGVANRNWDSVERLMVTGAWVQ
jgi:hypothetical protein